MRRVIRSGLRFVALLMMATLAAFAAAEPIDFRTEVLPILKTRCYSCHSDVSEMPKADLRLDNAGELSDYIDAGDASASYLFDLIDRDENDEERMPPVNSGPALSADQRQVIRDWIDSGANFGSWQSEPNWRKAPFHLEKSKRLADEEATLQDRRID